MNVLFTRVREIFYHDTRLLIRGGIKLRKREHRVSARLRPMDSNVLPYTDTHPYSKRVYCAAVVRRGSRDVPPYYFLSHISFGP